MSCMYEFGTVYCGVAPYELPDSWSPLPLHSLVRQRLHSPSAVDFVVRHLLRYVAMIVAVIRVVLTIPVRIVLQRFEQVFSHPSPFPTAIALHPVFYGL